SSRRRHTRFSRDWSSDVCSSDLVAGEALEERGERRMLMPQRLLQRHRRHLRQERQILGLLPFRESGVSRLVGGGFLFGGVALLPFGEGLVPHQAYTSERAPQQGGLLGVRVGPDLYAVLTKSGLLRRLTCVNAIRLWRTPFLPAVNG